MSTILLTENFPPKVGGSGRWFWELYRRLPREDFLLIAGSESGQDSFDDHHDLRLERLPLTFSSRLLRPTSFFEYRRAYLSLLEHVDRERPRLMHCGRWLPEGLLGWWLWRRRGLPYVCFAHGEEVNCFVDSAGTEKQLPSIYGSRELGLMASRVLKDARALIANSMNTKSILVDGWHLDESRVFCLNPGVDVDRFHPSASMSQTRRELGWSDRVVVLTVGRLQERKGQGMMIRAIPRLRSKIPNLLYVIVGSGEEEPRLRQAVAELGLEEHVEFRPAAADDELVKCYQGCDLFVLPNRAVGSDIEGFGMVLLEAQACGRPVVAGSSGGTKEAILVDRSGILVDSRTPESLVQGLQDLLSNQDLRNQMGEVGREWVVKNFGWQNLSKRAGTIFQEIQV